jgi:hypothetical protein
MHINVVTHGFLPLLWFSVSGCSLTFRVTSDVTKTDEKTITKEVFGERVRGNYVTISLNDRQLKSGVVLSVQGEHICLIEGQDTIDVQMQNIQRVHKRHEVVGAIVGLPVGTLLGGLCGFVVLGALQPGERLAGLGGLVNGSALGSVVGLIIGMANPPTTIYEFTPSSEIYEIDDAT